MSLRITLAKRNIKEKKKKQRELIAFIRRYEYFQRRKLQRKYHVREPFKGKDIAVYIRFKEQIVHKCRKYSV